MPQSRSAVSQWNVTMDVVDELAASRVTGARDLESTAAPLGAHVEREATQRGSAYTTSRDTTPEF